MTDTTYVETSVDLGAFVDALGKSVLRVHNIQARLIDADNFTLPHRDNSDYFGGFQLTTQTQTGMVSFTERALIAAGTLAVGSSQDAAGGQAITGAAAQNDLMPQDFNNGYLVAVDTIFLGGKQNIASSSGDCRAEIILECTVETLTQSAAMALALSQQ